MAYRESGFVFVIPLKARATARDWSAVLSNLSGTLGSLKNQSEPNFRALVACQDRPDIAALDDARFEWLAFAGTAANSDDAQSCRADKRQKIIAMGQRLRDAGADELYVTYLDADDLVHRDFVSTVLARDNHAGLRVKSGYFYDGPTHRLALRSEGFDRNCGSSGAYYVTADDLPTAPDDNRCYYTQLRRHVLSEKTAAARGRVLAPFAFPAALYHLNTIGGLQRLKVGVKKLTGTVLAPGQAAEILRRDFGWDEGARAALQAARAERQENRRARRKRQEGRRGSTADDGG